MCIKDEHSINNKKKLHYECKTRILKLGIYSVMSILAGEPNLTYTEDFGRAGGEIQNKVTKSIYKISDEI